jgi:hypothetical protein
MNDERPPKNAERVEKTPPVDEPSVEEMLRRTSAEVIELNPLHGKSPCVTSATLILESVFGS